MAVATKVSAKKKVVAEKNGSAIEVRSGIPLAPRSRKSSSIYPFATMDVEDSFFIPFESEDEEEQKKAQNRLTSACAAAKKKFDGRKFSIRKVVEDEVAGLACWRVE